MSGNNPFSTLFGSRPEVPFFRPAIVAGMSDDALTVGKLHPKLKRIRARAVARRMPFEEVSATELVVHGAFGPGFLPQAVTVVMAILGLRGSLEAPETHKPYAHVYSVKPNGHVRKERLWAPYRPEV
jgi:hypothetical protein